MGSDFNSCRFDFRLDVNTGLRQSRRRGRQRAAVRATSRNEYADNGGRCSTLYSCKICGCLLCSRSARKAHVLTHRQTSRVNHTSRSTNESSLVDPDHLSIISNCADQSQSSLVADHPQLDRHRMLFRRTYATELVLPSSAGVPQTSCHVLLRDATPGMTSSSLYFRSDVVDNTSAVVSVSNHMYSNNFRETNSSNDVLDLTTKTTASEQSPRPVISTNDSSNSDCRSLVVRQRKSRCLDVAIQKLWKFKLQQQSACATDDVTSHDLGRTMSLDNGDDLVNNTASLDQTEEQPSFEACVSDVTGSRSSSGGVGHVESKLKLRRLVAAPDGEQPMFYTLQSPIRRKTPLAVQRRIIHQPASNPSTRTHPGVTCRVCQYVATDADHLRSHLLATHGHEIEEFRATHLCTKCGRRFTSKANLAHHISSLRHHAGMTSLRRHKAHLSLRHRRLQLSHVHVGTKSYTQTVERRPRGSRMTSLQGTGSSVESATGRVTCEFPGCRREFRELKHLKVHRMQHTDERPLSCAICTYSCRQRNSLNWHMKSRHGLSKSVTDDGRTVYINESLTASLDHVQPHSLT